MLLAIRTLGDPVLREPAKPVERFDRALQQLAADMLETMYDAPGVGLAGPQVGLSMQVFVFDDGEHGPTFIANPELLDGEGDVIEEEGCLSIPGPYHPTSRFRKIRVRGLDVRGDEMDLVGEGLAARIFQHETDHLQGMLYIDRLDDEGRKEVLAELRRIELGLVDPRERKRR
jgi:peptide deformylase